MTRQRLRAPGTLLVLAFARPALAAESLARGLTVHLPLKADFCDHAAKPHAVEVLGRVELREGAAFFSGEESWLELPFIPLSYRAFSVAVWLKPIGSHPTYGVLLQRDRNLPGHILHLMIRNGLRPWLGFYINDVVSPVSLSNSGSWQHVVFQFDGAHQQIWINGRLICRRAAEPYRGAEGKTLLGKNPDWSNVPGKDYEGWMSDFRLYDRALTFPEIEALTAAPPAPITSLAATVKNAPAAQPAGSVAPAGASAVPLLAITGDKMRLRGKPGEAYVVEASADLAQWEVIGTVTVAGDGAVEFADEDARNFPQRFYRIRFRAPE